ncbi:MAG: PorV/PorQ family protein [Elusimicrobia bacterium]|nr:PorV/PorQ family protein [Elusimicrobiota bacterium]
MPGAASMRRLAAPLLAAACLSASGSAFASGTEGASFLDIPVGGRAAALGGAYSALASDGLAPVWNPAGLARLGVPQLAATHLLYVESIAYEHGSLALPVGAGGVGASVQYLHPKSMTQRDGDGSELGSFSSHFGAYGLSYGRGLTPRLSAGATGKLVEADIGGVSARAFAADLGALYRLSERFRLALVAANLGTRLSFIDAQDPLPQAYRAGLACGAGQRWNFAAEAAYDRSNLLAGRFGAEWQPVAPLALRAGYRTETSRRVPGLTGLTAGFGLSLLGQRFDYAWVPMGELGRTNYFSVLIAFGQGEK